jgi:hypothetical protein
LARPGENNLVSENRERYTASWRSSITGGAHSLRLVVPRGDHRYRWCVCVWRTGQLRSVACPASRGLLM